MKNSRLINTLNIFLSSSTTLHVFFFENKIYVGVNDNFESATSQLIITHWNLSAGNCVFFHLIIVIALSFISIQQEQIVTCNLTSENFSVFLCVFLACPVTNHYSITTTTYAEVNPTQNQRLVNDINTKLVSNSPVEISNLEFQEI